MDINTKFTKDTADISTVVKNAGIMDELMKEFIGKDDAIEIKNTISPKTQAIIVLFNKILDPGSVVREGEYDRAVVGQPIMDKIKSSLEKMTTGG